MPAALGTREVFRAVGHPIGTHRAEHLIVRSFNSTVDARISESRITAVEIAGIPRLRLLAAMYAFATVAVMVVLRLEHVGFLRLPPQMPRDIDALAIPVAGSICLLAATRTKLSARNLMFIGALYQLAGAFSIAWFEQAPEVGRGTAGTALWIMSYTLLPTRPLRTTLVAFGSALTGPAALALHVGLGHRGWPSDCGPLLDFGMSAAAATFAVITVRVIYGLGREIADARRIGAYTLVEKLGQGGMGEVWRAKHSALVRPAAIKLMSPRTLSDGSPVDPGQLTRRFQQEAQATALLKSPHTVAVYDFGEASDGVLYYVMELLNGVDLESLVETYGPQPAERTVHFLRHAAASLAEAHAQGLVHRDVKPANLFASVMGLELDFLKVLDFGLVRRTAVDVKLTAENGIWGTPAYIAPESAAYGRYDARSDIYSLGAVAYWLLTGKTLFDAPSGNAMIAAQIRDIPERPSLRTELPIPAELETIIMACLSKNPDERPQSAEQLSRMLDGLTLPAWTQRRADVWWRAHRPEVLARTAACSPSVTVPQRRARVIADAA
jgi:eukaryotic-like serine/threonine-protein kinase